MNRASHRGYIMQCCQFDHICPHFSLILTFLMIVHWKGISMQRHILASSTNLCIISEFDHFFFSHLDGLVLMLSLWLLLWFKTASTLSEAAMFNFDTKDFHRLVFCVQTTRKSSQAERNLRWNFEQAQISRKLPQAIASWQSNHSTPNSRLTMWVNYFVIYSFIIL